MGLAGKRVLLTTSHRNIGSGGSIQLLLLARALVEAGARVEALFRSGLENDPQRNGLAPLKALGVPVHFLRTTRWYSPAQIRRMRRLLRAGNFDIVHTHKGGDLSLALLALPGVKLPCLVNTRGVNFRLGANRFKYRLQRLDRIIVVSRDSKRAMVDVGVPGDKIVVVYGGVDSRRFQPLPQEREAMRAELGLPPDAVVSVVAANLVRQKGHEDYLAAAAALRMKRPELWHVFAGAGEQSHLRDLAAQLGVADRLVFAGFRGDMEHVYAACDLSVLASFAGEGVSGVLREAMACGLPVVTTDVGGNAELVRDGELGLIVPPRDPAALAAAIERLLAEPALAWRLAEAGRAEVLARFSTDARASNIFAVYESVFHDKGLAF